MENREGILDEIEELVNDFEKAEKNYLNPLTQRQIFKQEHSNNNFNRIISHHCQCGEKYNIFIWEQLNPMDHLLPFSTPYGEDIIGFNIRKWFFCSKCGQRVYIGMNNDFNIVEIKHDENFTI